MIFEGGNEVAPDVGFEPTTKRLTAAYSTAELIWNISTKGSAIIRENISKVKEKLEFVDIFLVW